MSYYFCVGRLSFDAFENFTITKMGLRIICPFLLQAHFHGELAKAGKMLTFLKRSKQNRKHLKGRVMNIVLASMQLITPFMLIASMIIVITQEPVASQITKAFATLMFVTGVDDMMAGSFPEDIKENAEKMNKQQILKMTKDHNSYSKICRRTKRNVLSCVGKKSSRSKRKSCSCLDFFNEMLNIVVNIWYGIINNF